MSDDTPRYGLSRRTILGGLGAIGAASVGAGLGTSAFFSDEETFEGNTLTAGTLDLKVDWQNLYYGPEESPVYGSAGRPYTGALPDRDDDGKQDELYTKAEIQADPSRVGLGADPSPEEIADAYRNQYANVPDDTTAPVVELADLKPGDQGCLDLSLHLFDNPGHIWMGGELLENAENGQTEPERDAEGEDTDGVGELADAIETTLFYDEDCDCEHDEGGREGTADVVIVLDESGSMDDEQDKFANAKAGAKNLVDALIDGTSIGLVSYEDTASVRQDLTTDEGAVKSAVDGLTAGGSTNMVDAVDTGQSVLDGGSADNQIMVFLTNGQPTSGGGPSDVVAAADAAKNAGTELFTIAYGSSANFSLLTAMASTPKDIHAYLADEIDAVESVFSTIGGIIAGERVIFEGSLADLTAELETGIPLDGDRSTPPEVVTEDGEPTLVDRECFENSTTHCIALHWELPAEVGNEVQSDTVAFDVNFYAEQCRHNEGVENPFDASARSAIEYYD